MSLKKMPFLPCTVLLGSLGSLVAVAQTESNARGEKPRLEEIVVTATKKGAGERLQDVPASITALGISRLEALHVTTLESLTTAIPNVQFDKAGAQPGIANFTIRGLGVNSSIPSIEPTVGTFIDGIYLGTNYGVLFDTFDLESIEVLRGPQGVLFGRNVTGGAVLLRHARPTNELQVKGKLDVETGLSTTAGIAVGGPVTDGVQAKLAGYFAKDEGYFRNVTSGQKNGKREEWYVRPILVLRTSDTAETTFIAEYGEHSGDGSVIRNTKYADKNETASNEPGFADYTVRSLTIESNVDTRGGGKITNLAGYRKFGMQSLYDTDGSPQNVYHIGYDTKQEQFSNELRYAGTIFGADVVVGAYYFTESVRYLVDEQVMYANLRSIYGGNMDANSVAVFGNVDIPLAKQFTLGLGARLARDKKQAEIATRSFAPPLGPCASLRGPCINDFQDSETFDSFIPRVGLKWQPSSDYQVYGYYAGGARGGGYNLRSASKQDFARPGPFGDETLDSFEAGWKSILFDGRLLFNAAVFYTEVSDLQREQTIFMGSAFTNIGNAADARFQGGEVEVNIELTDGLTLFGSYGYTDGKYTSVSADLTGDGLVDQQDLALKIPRLARETYSIGLSYERYLGSFGTLSAQANFDHRDGSFFDEKNTSPLPSLDIIGGTISLSPDAWKGLKFTAYVKNLTDEENYGLRVNLASVPTGGIIKAISKGKVVGGQVTYTF